ncbi:VOC family protein [Sorangium sp. So ce1078]|uniref:VOC family protein n=1 Tax=Sorangium sp. So ce1078 TaxID=3133329 RepID=UPI003F5F987F
MHRSRLCSLVIDCKVDDIDAAADFWGRALGKPVKKAGPDAGGYRELETRDDELIVLLQKVDHPSRTHLDIEADDLDAEVRRLEALGARRVEFVQRWWVMEAPTGQRFCVVRPQRGPLEAHGNANVWSDEPGKPGAP